MHRAAVNHCCHRGRTSLGQDPAMGFPQVREGGQGRGRTADLPIFRARDDRWFRRRSAACASPGVRSACNSRRHVQASRLVVPLAHDTDSGASSPDDVIGLAGK
jgi:hypothetical protein